MNKEQLKRRTKDFALRVMKLVDHLPKNVFEETDESALWMELVADGGLLKQSSVEALLAEANELAAIMFSARRTTQRNANS